jgi:hypothetical protein
MRSILLPALLLTACGPTLPSAGEPAELEAAAAEPSAEAAWTPSAEEQAVYEALSIRDPAPDCAAVEALAAEPRAALLAVVEHASMPPWAPMRAAHCLTTRHTEASKGELLAWMSQEETRGLALLVMAELDGLAEPIAVELAQAALAGPLAEDARSRLAESEREALRALVTAER